MRDTELPLSAHLAELRTRLLRALAAVAVAFAICYPSSGRLFSFLSATGEDGVPLIGTGVAEAFFTRLKVSAIAAFFVALPVVLWEIWRFIVPGLYENEARYARGFVVAGTLFFLSGALFCYRVVFPIGFPFFLAEYAKIGVEPAIRIGEYLSFASRLLLAFGITFELPVATFFLARAGVLTHRTLIDYGRYAVLAVFVLAAVLTPPDAASQLLMAGPLLLLYGVSILIAYLARKR